MRVKLVDFKPTKRKRVQEYSPKPLISLVPGAGIEPARY
jgi:hypothetical protein